MKQGDIGKKMYFLIRDMNGGIVDLSAVSSITLKTKIGTTTRTDVMTVSDATAGKALFTVPSGFTTTAGIYQYEVTVVFSGGGTFTTKTIKEVIDARL